MKAIQVKAVGNERGRPRNFDRDAALDLALQVFWLNGFQAASLTELTGAMGVNKPSLYAAFGDKESLYLQALQRYTETRMPQHLAVLETEPNGRSAVSKFLRSMVSMYADPALPGGCFIVNGAAECGSPSTPARVDAALRTAIQGSETVLLDRLMRAQRDGQLKRSANTRDLAAFFSSVLAGLGVLAKTGAKKSKLDAIVNAAMGIWPEPPA